MPEQPATIALPDRLHKRLRDHALATPKVEVCGLLGGHDNRLLSYYPVDNISPAPEIAFLLQAEGQIAALRAMRASGEELRGIFHSHPDAPAAPSATDLALAAYPGVYYLILSLAGAEPELGGFHYDGKRFTRVPISD